jgi:pSer/pThr/pTyr-binding forkhead associated (FHA) protein
MRRNPKEVELPLPGLSVSRQHVAFFPLPNAIEVEDLSLANGTFLSWKQCGRERLSDRDSLVVGRREITVHVLPRDRTLVVEAGG